MILDADVAASTVKARLQDPTLGIPAVLVELDEVRGPVAGEVRGHQVTIAVEPDAPREDRVAPRFYSTADRVRLEPDEYPAVLVVPQDTVDIRSQGTTRAGVETFRTRYRLRVFFFARGPSEELTAAIVRRIASAGAEALVRTPALRLALPDDAEEGDIGELAAEVDPNSLRGSWSDVEPDDSEGRYVAGAWVEVQVAVPEHTGPAPLGTVETVELDVHPGLQ